MPDDPQYRSTHTHRPGEVDLRQTDDDDGMMSIRLPIASTGEVRNDGDDPLSPGELRGMAEQVDSLTRGVFPEHGASDMIDFAGYSQFEKLGYWSDGEVESGASADDEDLLFARANMPDPETLPAATGSYRQALAILKEQAKRGIPITTSIGWREDDGAPGGNDLMEASIVGIGADPRTATEGGEALVARAAVAAGADPDELIERVREAVEEDTHDMTDEDTDTETETDEEQAAETETEEEAVREEDEEEEEEEEEEASMSAEEFRTEMLDLQRQQMDTLEALAESIRPDDDDEEEEDDDDDDEEQAAEEADEDEERDAPDGELAERINDLEDELAAVRSGEVSIETPDDDDEERDADEQPDETDPADKPAWARTD